MDALPPHAILLSWSCLRVHGFKEQVIPPRITVGSPNLPHLIFEYVSVNWLDVRQVEKKMLGDEKILNARPFLVDRIAQRESQEDVGDGIGDLKELGDESYNIDCHATASDPLKARFELAGQSKWHGQGQTLRWPSCRGEQYFGHGHLPQERPQPLARDDQVRLLGRGKRRDFELP